MSTLDFNQRHSLQAELNHIEQLTREHPDQAETLKPILLYINRRIEELTEKIS